MFIANLIASVLALAMVGASTASVSKYENNAVLSAENTSFVASPKKAYYDPAETYGHNANKFYNYTDQTLYVVSPDDMEVYGDAFVLETGEFCNIVDDNGEYNIFSNSGWFAFGDLTPNTSFTNEDVLDLPIDLYIDGELVEYGPNEDYEFCVYNTWQIPNSGSGHYFWIFDHQETEAYTPVDMLGDIAEGLTGGIVPVAEGIGSGLQSLVQDIFLNAAHDGLSVFGIVIICFAGLALALGLSRWVLNFVDTLGARDR